MGRRIEERRTRSSSRWVHISYITHYCQTHSLNNLEWINAIAMIAKLAKLPSISHNKNNKFYHHTCGTVEGLNCILETVSSGGDWTSTSFMGLGLVLAGAAAGAVVVAAPKTLRLGWAAPKLVAPNMTMMMRLSLYMGVSKRASVYDVHTLIYCLPSSGMHRQPGES